MTVVSFRVVSFAKLH